MRCMKLNWKFRRGGRVQPKSNPMREGGGGGKGMDIFRITYVFLLHSLPVKYESIKKLLCLCCHLNSCRIKGHLFAGP